MPPPVMADNKPEVFQVNENQQHNKGSDEGLERIDTVHGDEAAKILGTYSGDETWTPQEEKKLKRRIDLKLLPVLCVTYGLLYYDKVMLGHAALFGIRQDLGLLVGDRYSMSAAIFYFGFILGAYPATLLAQRYPIERVASAVTIVWGTTLICTPACTNYQGLYAQRFFLGFTEAGISPMFMMIVGGWYTKGEQSLRMGAWYCCTGYVTIFAPLVNYGLGQINGALSPWKYMYFFAGAITILWGIIVYFVLIPDPIRAKGFTDRERFIAVSRMRVNNTTVRNTHFKTSQARELFTGIKFWLIFFYAFFAMIANGPVSTFATIIINGMGFSGVNSLLLKMPSGAYAGTLMLTITYLCFKLPPGWRAYLIVLCQSLTILASCLLWKLPASAVGGRLFALYILPSVGAGYAAMMGMFLANNGGYTKRSLASSGLYVGYCFGNIAGPLVFDAKESPYYTTGWIVTVASAVAAAVLVLIYRFLCSRENKRRDASGTREGFEHANDDDLTDQTNPQFRYLY